MSSSSSAYAQRGLGSQQLQQVLHRARTGEIIGLYVASAHNDLPVGQRRWVEDIYHLPAIDDGECFVVTVRFEQAAGKVTQTFRNGIA